MATRVFLLSGDEKAVHAITQVFDEQDVRFEHSSDAAFSLKRLAVQHFDLLIVDCHNSENATQVFNSARASQINKNAIAVAIVEGKAGVPNAFRLGASLVLTKPVSLEQVRNTLRTGIGMARKEGTDLKPLVPIPPAPVTPPVNVPHVIAPAVSTPAVSAPVVSAPPMATVQPMAVAAAPAPAPAPTPVVTHPPAAVPAPVAAFPAATPPVIATMAASASADSASSEKVAAAVAEVEKVVEMISAISAAQEPEAKPIPVPEVSPMIAEVKPAVPAPGESKPAGKVVDFTIASAAKTAAAAAPAPAFSSVDLLSDPKESAASLPEEVKALDLTPVTEDEKKEETTDENHVEETAQSLRLGAVPAFGGLAKEPFAGLPSRKRSGSGFTVLGVAAVVVGGFAAAWFYAPGFKERVQGAYAQARALVPHGHQASAAVSVPKPATPVVPQPAVTTPPPAEALAPSSTGEVASTSSLTAAAQPTVEAAKTVSNTPASSGPQTSASANASAPSAGPKTASAAPAAATPAPAVAKPSGETPKNSPSLVNTSATPTPTVVKAKPSDLFEVPEDYADDQVIHRVHPQYPRQARAKQIQGTVVLQAIVDKQGKVDSLQLVSGDPLLAQAAADAVKQWRYKPYSHNGDPAEFQTRVTVDFKLP